MFTRRPILLAAFVFLAASFCHAQFDTATVLGTVTDSSGAVVPGAAVMLENLATGVVTKTRTSTEGNYEFLTVKIGRYLVRVTAEGFSAGVSEPFDVTVAARQRVNLALKIGATTETITVTGAARLVETDSSDRGQVVRTEQIVNLPLNGRAYADLALLGTGVRKSLSTSRDASFNVNGQRAALNNFIIDGLDNNSYATSNQGYSNQVVQASPDALAEFKVQTNNYSAEYGRASGAVVNASIRSGTNSFRGSAWEFMRNTQLNAVGFFKPVSGVKPTLTQNQFGFTFGGPILRDRTFFFVDYEGFRAVSHAVTFATLPTVEHKQGNVGVPFVHPITGGLYPDGKVPLSEQNPYARKILDETPAPNLPGLATNYSWMPRGQVFSDKGDAKIDHRFGDKLSVFARASQRKMNNFEPPAFPGPSNKGGNAHIRALNQHLALAGTYVIDPRSLVEVRMGISRTNAGKTPDGVGGPGMDVLYGVTGLPKDPRYYGGLMTVDLGGYTGFGRQSSNPQFQNPHVLNPKVNYSRMMNRHTLKAGYEYQFINTEIDDFNPKSGSEGYGSQFSRPKGASSNNLFNLVDMLYGARDKYEVATPTVANVRQQMHYLYLQDDLRVTRNLMVNLGLRYELATPQYERDNQASNFDPATRTMLLAKSGSIFDRTYIHTDRNNFAPRLGAAYTLNPRTVIRSAYGISYVHFNRLGAENQLVANYPFFIDVVVRQQPNQPLCTANDSPLTCFRPQQMGFPQDLASTRNATLAAQGWIYYIPQTMPTAYVQNWHFTIQRELAKDLMLDVAYVGSHGIKLVVLGDANQARPNGTNENLPIAQRRLFTDIQNVEESLPAGFSNYQGLQIKLERRFTGSLYLLNSFTWSKAMDNAAGHLEANSGDNSRVNIQNLALEKGISNYNQPFNDTTTVIWDLPYGKGRHFGAGAHPVLQGVLGGWRLSAINTMTSGQPFTLRYSPTSQFTVSGLPSYRPNLIGDPLAPASERSIDNYLSKTNVIAPTDPSQPFGNASRNNVRSYAFYNTDIGLHKQFPLPGESRRLEFRGEVFNLFNHTNFTVPDSNRNSNGYGTIRGTFPSRILQMGLKVYF